LIFWIRRIFSSRYFAILHHGSNNNNNLIQFNSLLFMCWANSRDASYRHSTV
jgi:hypothetical protein